MEKSLQHCVFLQPGVSAGTSQSIATDLSIEKRSLYMYHVIDGTAEVSEDDRTIFKVQEAKKFSPVCF